MTITGDAARIFADARAMYEAAMERLASERYTRRFGRTHGVLPSVLPMR